MKRKNRLLIGSLGLFFWWGMFSATGWANDAKIVGWNQLSRLNTQTGDMTPDLQQINGEAVRIPGYIVPLEGVDGEITEFLLVPTEGACIHIPPPPPNQIVHVIMEKGFSDEYVFDPVWVTGVLNIGNKTSIFADANYTMEGVQVIYYE